MCIEWDCVMLSVIVLYQVRMCDIKWDCVVSKKFVLC